MSSDKLKEFQDIQKRAEVFAKDLDSENEITIKNAEANLATIKKELEAWAKKHGSKIIIHEVSGGNAQVRARCKPTMGYYDGANDTTYSCILIGKKRRNCLYSCVEDIFGAGNPSL